MRAFFALHLDRATIDALTNVPWRPLLTGERLRFVESHNLHVTLRFLGDVGEGDLEKVTAAAREASSLVPEFDLVVQGIVSLPPRGAPRVIAADADGGGDLARLHREITLRLAPLGFPPEGRPFHPHVTLARVKARLRGGELVPPEAASRRFGVTRVRAVHLMASELSPKGPRYAIVESVPLAGP